MANSRLGMEAQAITEGAVMAGLTAVLALAGIYIPLLEPIISMVWTLPVVVVCIRRGIRTGAAAMAVAGAVIMISATPMSAADMLLRYAGPALLLGCGFRYRWRTERTVLFTAAAAFAGLILSFSISAAVMGIGIPALLSVDTETMDELVRMFTDYDLLSALNMTANEMRAMLGEVFAMLAYSFPGILAVSGLAVAVTNYAAARFVLKRLGIPLPPAFRLSVFRLPLGFVFAFIAGFGMVIIGNTFLPWLPLIVIIGQNIVLVFTAVYFFQGMGVFAYFVGKASPSVRTMAKVLLLLIMLMTFFSLMPIIGYAGVADALFDFRKLDVLPKKEGPADEEPKEDD